MGFDKEQGWWARRGGAMALGVTCAALAGASGCSRGRREEPPRPTPAVVAPPVVRAPVDVPPPDAPAPEETLRNDGWTRAYGDEPLDPATQRQWLAEAAQPDGDSAAFALGRRAPMNTLNTVLGGLPGARLDVFLRGLVGRPLGTTVIPAGWTARWSEEPASVALGTLLGKSAIALEPTTAALTEPMLLDADLEHQVAAARSLQNVTVPLPALSTLLALHPVALALAARSLAQRGPGPLWVGLLTSLAPRVRANPRSWAGAWLAVVDAAPVRESGVRAALLDAEAPLAEVALTPTAVNAAFHCAVALRLDRLDEGHRCDACAAGPDEWRALAAMAERSRPPMEPRLVDATLRNVLSRAADHARVIEAVVQSAVLLPPVTALPLLQLVVDQRDPGVLASLLEALTAHPEQARALPADTVDRLLQAPFDLPEPASLEARLYAVRLRQALGRPTGEVRSTVRAIRLAVAPDAGVAPRTGPMSPPSVAGAFVLNTSAGFIRIELRADTAPETLALLRETIAAGTYRRTTFHRVVAGFVAQGGDPRGDGYGGITRIVPTEVSGARFERGAVGIALAGLDTGGTQFFITLADAPHLDARYPYLGRVVAGMNVADRLMPGDEIIDATFVPARPAPL